MGKSNCLEIPDESSVIMTVVSSVSIAFCLPVILTALLPALRDQVYIQVVVYIQISNLLAAIGTVYGYVPARSLACTFQGILASLFPLASVFWTTFISYLVYRLLLHDHLVEIDYKTHLVCWGLPIILTFLPYINATYSTTDDGFCEYVPNAEGSIFWSEFWYWFGFYVWIWFGIIISLLMYLVVIIYSGRLRREEGINYSVIIRKLFMYPLILIISWLLSTVLDGAFAAGSDLACYNLLLMLTNGFICSQDSLTSLYFFYVNQTRLVRELESINFDFYKLFLWRSSRVNPVVENPHRLTGVVIMVEQMSSQQEY